MSGRSRVRIPPDIHAAGWVLVPTEVGNVHHVPLLAYVYNVAPADRPRSRLLLTLTVYDVV